MILGFQYLKLMDYSPLGKSTLAHEPNCWNFQPTSEVWVWSLFVLISPLADFVFFPKAPQSIPTSPFLLVLTWFYRHYGPLNFITTISGYDFIILSTSLLDWAPGLQTEAVKNRTKDLWNLVQDYSQSPFSTDSILVHSDNPHGLETPSVPKSKICFF